jgi:5-methylcytosine-specific restriction endonuclease McrA
MRLRLTKLQRYIVWKTTEGHCAECGIDLPLWSPWHADHTIPFRLTQRTLLSECRPLCAPCNLRKGDKHAETSDLSRGFRDIPA